MASELTELAREVGGDELAERVERLEDEIEEGDISESAVEDMSLQDHSDRLTRR